MAMSDSHPSTRALAPTAWHGGGGGGGAGGARLLTAGPDRRIAAAPGNSSGGEVMRVYTQPLDQSNYSSVRMGRQGSGGSAASFASGPPLLAPGERSVASSTASSRRRNALVQSQGRDLQQDLRSHGESDGGRSEHPYLRESLGQSMRGGSRRSVYEDAQSQASFRTGGSMYGDGAASRYLGRSSHGAHSAAYAAAYSVASSRSGVGNGGNASFGAGGSRMYGDGGASHYSGRSSHWAYSAASSRNGTRNSGYSGYSGGSGGHDSVSRGSGGHDDSGQGSGQGSSSGGNRSSLLRNSFPTVSSGTGPTYINPHPAHKPLGVSMSGNLLVHVEIEEDAGLELDRNEIQELLTSVGAEEDSSAEVARFQQLNDTSTIGTTKSLRSFLSKSSKNVTVDGNPDGTYNLSTQSDAEKQQARVKEVIFSPPFRRRLFVGICFVLMGLGVLLTLENFMTVKTASDWLEPHRDKYLLAHGGGIDWAFGTDAPRPLAGALVDDGIESRLADWHQDTSRIPAAAGVDGFGSVAVSEAAMFKDVPVFWGLPFAGGDILESVLGQCLNLVQASDKGTDGDGGDDLHLRTVANFGKTYLNVDLSSVEGIERASALALGTSGMADVAHSPLLHEVSELFSPMNRGRLFVLVRHPVEREFARLRHLARGKLLGEKDEGMTYVEYARSDLVADNWMTRTLVWKGEDEDLTADDMRSAKEALRRKAVVGLYSDIIGAARHYARHFGWDHARSGGKLNRETLSCFERAILEGMERDMDGAGYLAEEEAREGTAAWGRIMSLNKFDYELYVYSRQLYKFQLSLS